MLTTQNKSASKIDLERKTANEKEGRIKRQIGEVGERKTEGKW
jgi:hypothetical protein